MTKNLFNRLKNARFPGSHTWTTPEATSITVCQFMDARYEQDRKRGVKYVHYHFEKHTAKSDLDGVEVRIEKDDPIGWLWLLLNSKDDTQDS